jgi:multidrug efflux pump
VRASAFTLLPVAPLPRIDVPAIFVSAQLPGASPEVMASTVATPLERHLGAIADVDDMTSTSSVGTTNIQLTFGVDRDIDGAARDVQAAIVAAHADLPSSLTHNPTYRKLNSAPVSRHGHRHDLGCAHAGADLRRGGRRHLAAPVADKGRRRRQRQRQRAAGGARGDQSAVAVQVRHRLAGRPRRHLQRERQRAQGRDRVDQLHYQIYTNDNARDAAPYRNLIIANRNGATVRLGDVAEVLDMQDGATENIRTYGLYNGKPAVFVQVFQQPGANIIE